MCAAPVYHNYEIRPSLVVMIKSYSEYELLFDQTVVVNGYKILQLV
jgi:hypothetical protein